MFRLIATVKRGTASDIEGIWVAYDTLDEARAAAGSLSRDERVGHIMIARDDVPATFVEWVS